MVSIEMIFNVFKLICRVQKKNLWQSMAFPPHISEVDAVDAVDFPPQND
jgi:hypothetical protein